MIFEIDPISYFIYDMHNEYSVYIFNDGPARGRVFPEGPFITQNMCSLVFNKEKNFYREDIRQLF